MHSFSSLTTGLNWHFTCLDMELVTLLVILKHFNKIFWYISLLYSPECSRSCESGAVTCQSWQLLERHQRHNGRQHSTHGDREKQPLDYHVRDDDHNVFLHHHQSWNHQKITQMQKTAAFFNITWEHTGTPSLPTPLTFRIFLHIIHPQWKCQTRRKRVLTVGQKQMTFIKRGIKRRIFVSLWVCPCVYPCTNETNYLQSSRSF